jgi:hypothetical protein
MLLIFGKHDHRKIQIFATIVQKKLLNFMKAFMAVGSNPLQRRGVGGEVKPVNGQ